MSKESVFVHLKTKTIKLEFSDFDESIDVDELTSINYSNLYGESITVSALLNKIGLLRAEAEEVYSMTKIELDIFEANLRKKIRREAASNGGKVLISEKPEEYLKLTEKALDDLVIIDEGWQIKKKNIAKRKKDLDFIDSLFWAIKDKSSKLNNLLPQVVPEDLEKEIVEGKINGMMVSKHNKQYSK